MLRWLVARGARTLLRASALSDALRDLGARLPSDAAYRRPGVGDAVHAAQALAEAWEWLRSEALIAETIAGFFGRQLPVERTFFVTRLGRRLASHPRPREWLRGQRRLEVELHPRLEERARRQFVLGEFAAAALVSMREVEIAVRELGGFGPEELGTSLMNRAFSPDNGPLRDDTMTSSERQGLQSLYRGAIAVGGYPLGSPTWL